MLLKFQIWEELAVLLSSLVIVILLINLVGKYYFEIETNSVSGVLLLENFYRLSESA